MVDIVAVFMTREVIPSVLASTWIGDEVRTHVGQAEGAVEFAVPKQTAIRTDG